MIKFPAPRRVVAWCNSPKGKCAIFLKLVISVSIISFLISPYVGQVFGVIGNMIWLWIRTDAA